MIGEEQLRIRGKLNFFMDEKVEVHVKKVDGYFWNGLIIDKKSDEIYIFKDRKLGLVHLFISDIVEIEEYRGFVDGSN